MGGLMRDGREAMRSLLRRPGFFATGIAMLTIGIGLNAAMFSVVNRLLIKPLPYPNAGRLVQLSETAPDLETMDLSFPDFDAWRSGNRSFESMAAFDDTRVVLRVDGEPRRVEAALTSASLLHVLGLQPSLGRFFTADEEQPGRDGVVVVSYGLWAQQYGKDPNIIGRSILVNDRSRTVVGVAPEGFRFPEVAMLWVPLALNVASADPENFTYDVVARLKPDVTVAAARAEGETLIRRHAIDRGITRANVGVEVYPLKDADVSPQLRWASVLLLAAVGAVLLVACINLAVLVATRGMSRHSEIAVRVALGATRLRILAHLTAETALLTTVGALGGVAFGAVLVRGINALLPAERPFWMVAEIDISVFAFVLLVAMVATLVVGILPARQTTRVLVDLRGSRGVGRSFARAQSAMVAIQVAMSLALLVGAAVALDGVRRLESRPLGVDANGVLTVAYQIPRWVARDPVSLQAINAQVLSTIQAVPGVDAVGIANEIPVLSGGDEVVFAPPGSTGGSLPVARLYELSPGAFSALRMRLVSGRLTDAITEPAVILSEALAERYWSNDDVLGTGLRHGLPGARSPQLSPDAPQSEVVGVVANVRRPGRPDESPFAIYAVRRQPQLAQAQLIVRTPGEASSVVSAVRARLREAIPDALVDEARPLSDAVRNTLVLQQMFSRGFSVFALLALGMAAVGLWGITAYAVGLRRSELAVRRALGASDTAIVRTLLRGATASVVPGLVLGCVLAWALASAIETNIPGIGTAGGWTSLAAALVFLAIAYGASYLPARRALRIEPTEALRSQ